MVFALSFFLFKAWDETTSVTALEPAGKSTLPSPYYQFHFPSSHRWSAHRDPAFARPEAHSVGLANHCGSCFTDGETALESGQTLDLAGPRITTLLTALGWRGEADVHGSQTASVLIRGTDPQPFPQARGRAANSMGPQKRGPGLGTSHGAQPRTVPPVRR